MNIATTTTGNNGGFTLLEAILALALFTASALALTEALALIGLTSVESQQLAQQREILRSQLIEETFLVEPQAASREIFFEEADLRLKITTEEPQLVNQDGDTLTDMMKIVIEAYPFELGNDNLIDRVETYRYTPLYSPIRQ